MQNNIEITLLSVLVTFIGTMAVLFLAGYFAWKRRPVLALVCGLCFFALFRPTVAMSAEFCKPVRYADGDTFTFKRNGESVRVRLAGYDAPERGQPFSKKATQYLRELTRAGANCDCYKRDRYGRSVCTVRTLDGDNIAKLMLDAGFGCIDARFEQEASAEDRAVARAALADAQRTQRGMWSDKSPVCAADDRRAKSAKR